MLSLEYHGLTLEASDELLNTAKGLAEAQQAKEEQEDYEDKLDYSVYLRHESMLAAEATLRILSVREARQKFYELLSSEARDQGHQGAAIDALGFAIRRYAKKQLASRWPCSCGKLEHKTIKLT